MDMNERDQKLEVFKSAVDYLAGNLAKGKKGDDTNYPVNRGDIVILLTLIEQELQVAPSDWTYPLNVKRLTAIRGKLGNLAFDTPEMSKMEAQQFRE